MENFIFWAVYYATISYMRDPPIENLKLRHSFGRTKIFQSDSSVEKYTKMVPFISSFWIFTIIN